MDPKGLLVDLDLLLREGAVAKAGTSTAEHCLGECSQRPQWYLSTSYLWRVFLEAPTVPVH